MKRDRFYWGNIKDRDIEYIYLRDIFNKHRKGEGHKMMPPEYPLAYNEWGKVVRPFGERRGIHTESLNVDKHKDIARSIWE